MAIGDIRQDQRFDSPHDPRFPLPKGAKRTEETRKAYFEAHNERWKIVSICSICSRELVAEEVQAHKHSHLSSRARVLARMLDDASDEVQQEVLEYLLG